MRKAPHWLVVSALLALVTATVGITADPAQGQETELPVYADALAPGWQDWSYNGITRDLAHTAHTHTGSAAIAVTCTGSWSALMLGYGGSYLDVSAYDALRFWVHGGSAGGQPVNLIITLRSGSIEQAVTPTANTWTQVDVSLLAHASREVYSIEWFNDSDSSQPTFYLDDVAFVGTGAPTPSGLALSVDAAADRHLISPYVYGINFAGEAMADELSLPVRRRGGNSTTRYNWQLDVHNTGSDWYYENIPDAPGTVDQFVEQDRRTGTQTLLTMPLIGWTPKRRRAGHPYDCGYRVSKYGAQDSVDPWDIDCGNGEQGGVPIAGNDPADTSVPITTTFVVSWVNHLTGKYGTAAAGGVMFYDLDNEPMLWNDTHRDVHPTPTSYDELRDRTWTYAAAIKAADPTAQTLGPVVWGWTAYFWSALDRAPGGAWWQNPLDRLAHGNVPFVEWYLQQMQAYQTAHGVRILDYLDVHYYPQAPGVTLSPAGDSTVQARRLRSTRSLWDPTYVDESWIGEPVVLIPRMKQWVADDYPGTKLAVTEYNWGGLEHINGALAQADVLGIFGREGLDLAALWDPPDVDDPGTFAFRMYRNYDGQGRAFGETSIRASSTDQDKLAVYASQRGAGGALTLMAINKTGQVVTGTLTLANFQPAPYAQVYRYSPADLTAIVHEPDQSVTVDGFTALFPANSITLFVIPSGTPLIPRLYLPVVLNAKTR